MLIPQTLMKLPQKPLLAGLLIASLTFPTLGFAQSSDAHHREYQAALDVVTSSEAKLTEAMQQVQSGQVAHYDFLQFELIELIRHTRALAWPPGSVATNTKDAIHEEAIALRNSAEALEWVVTDFLRAFAQVRSAASNTLDIAEQALPDATDSTKADWQALQVETLKFMASAYQQGSEELAQAFDRVLANDLSEQTTRELSFQKERLAIYPDQLQGFIDKLVDSDVDVRAAKLKAMYEAAI